MWVIQEGYRNLLKTLEEEDDQNLPLTPAATLVADGPTTPKLAPQSAATSRTVSLSSLDGQPAVPKTPITPNMFTTLPRHASGVAPGSPTPFGLSHKRTRSGVLDEKALEAIIDSRSLKRRKT